MFDLVRTCARRGLASVARSDVGVGGGGERGVTHCRHSGAASRCGAPGAATLAGALAAASMAPMPPFEPPALLKRLAASASAVTGGSRDGAKRALSQLAVAAAVGGLAGGAAYAGMVRACARPPRPHARAHLALHPRALCFAPRSRRPSRVCAAWGLRRTTALTIHPRARLFGSGPHCACSRAPAVMVGRP